MGGQDGEHSGIEVQILKFNLVNRIADCMMYRAVIFRIQLDCESWHALNRERYVVAAYKGLIGMV